MSLPPFQRVVDEHAAAVMRLLVDRAGPQDAEDCFQETFLAALRAYPHLDDARNPRPWLLTIAAHKAIDAHRRRARRPVPRAVPPERGAPDPEPPDAALWARVGELPRRQRAAVALRFACDLSYAEIAALAGGSEAAARRNVHVGLTTLRRELSHA
jgi:RNA polymerase sigma factor (sigma-70 family)